MSHCENKDTQSRVVVAHIINPNTWEAEVEAEPGLQSEL